MNYLLRLREIFRTMSIKKKYLRSKPVCKVTLRLPKEAAPEAKVVHVAGEFNDWNAGTVTMTKLKSGEFKTTLELEAGREYQFKYLIDNTSWENDWSADRYVADGIAGDNSVIVL